ncbi:MAG: hypothetical protein K2Q14_06630 [Gammaproteobacteria bacterium]|nr:hypothetical protein [Gammaproteobacteria bacterium]
MVEEQHQYLRGYINAADQKAIFFFTICTGLLTYLNAQNITSLWKKNIHTWCFTDFAACVAMIGLALASLLFLYVVTPRLKGSKKGVIFFRSIAEYDNGNEYAADIVRLGEKEIAVEKLKHCYELAKICNAKFNKLAWGLYIGGVAIFFALLYLLVH